jgi:hypothetical protein
MEDTHDDEPFYIEAEMQASSIKVREVISASIIYWVYFYAIQNSPNYWNYNIPQQPNKYSKNTIFDCYVLQMWNI